MAKVLLYDFLGSICSQMARLALAEKGVRYTRQNVDIMETHAQFEPWYVALNPKAVVPTLRIDDQIVTDTKDIVARVDSDFDGPPLTPQAPGLMRQMMNDIMGLHYGVLLYSGGLGPDRTSDTIIARGEMLARLLHENPAMATLLQGRIDGNRRFQAILADADAVEGHIEAARALVGTLNQALCRHQFVADAAYSLADTFATAALARFRLHGFSHWWQNGQNPAVAAYLDAMRARPSWEQAGVVDSRDPR